MDAKVISDDDQGIAVEVEDHAGELHHFLFDRDGRVKEYFGDRFEGEIERGTEPARVLRRVQRRAKFYAHHESDEDLVHRSRDPEVLEDAIEILDELSPGRFRELFGEYAEAVHRPPVEGRVDEVVATAKWLYLNESRDEIVDATDHYPVRPDEGTEYLSPETFDDDPDVLLAVPPLERELEDPPTEKSPPDELVREAIVDHLKCQVRDQYYMQGRRPPEEYRVDGRGVHDGRIVPFEEQSK